MNVYTAIQEFSAPQISSRIHVGDTVGKLESSVGCIVDGVEHADRAFYDWVGSVGSVGFLTFSGTISDPGALTSGQAAIGSGVREVAVVRAFGFVPSSIIATVTKPDADGVNLFATVKEDSITANGFTVELSGSTTSTGYILNYFVE